VNRKKKLRIRPSKYQPLNDIVTLVENPEYVVILDDVKRAGSSFRAHLRRQGRSLFEKCILAMDITTNRFFVQRAHVIVVAGLGENSDAAPRFQFGDNVSLIGGPGAHRRRRGHFERLDRGLAVALFAFCTSGRFGMLRVVLR
jgi:hypothetical protein